MNRMLLLSSCIMWILPFTVQAQERGEISVFGGYSHLWADVSANHGWIASLAGNIARHMALVADFSGQHSSMSYAYYGVQTEAQYRSYSFLFGPRYVRTIGKRWTPFAHALVGLKRDTSEGWYSFGSTPVSYGPSSNYIFLPLALGGGIDIRLGDRVSVRALQLDGVGMTEYGGWGYYVQASFGAVFRLSGVSK